MKPQTLMQISLAIILINLVIFGYQLTNYYGVKEYASVKVMPPLNITINNNLSELDTIKIIAQAVSEEKNYTVNVHDCTQFSIRLTEELQNRGINAYCVTGFYDKGNKSMVAHTWVEVNDSNVGKINVEATGGFIIPNNIYKNLYAPFTQTGRGWCR